ncbi:hypothetical protein [Metabacillus sp. Hm71]|uniref:hypothetical protein n=1 Tax=Metabacillus sp. Hm71 TaxID=3450743 RepID=UPI003F42D01D
MLPFILCFSMIFVFFPQSKAAAAWYFQTDNARWSEGGSDGYIQVKSGQTVDIKINSCSRVNRNNNVATQMSVTDCGPALAAEICNPTTGNCTSRYTIGSDGFLRFTNMKGASYEIYIYDSWSSYYFTGWANYSPHY